MTEYKRLKPFNKELLTGLVGEIKNHTREITEKQQIEADSVGLDIICASTDPNKNLYRYRDCGHTEYLQPTHVRRNNFRCSTCQHSKEVKEAQQNNITFLFKTKGVYRLYLRGCGHISEMTVRAAQLYKGNCKQCFEEKMNSAAIENGYAVIGYESSGRRLIRFEKCGHEKTVHQAQLFKGNVVCRQCLFEDHINVVRSQGLELVTARASRYHSYCLPCGHSKTLRQDHAEDGVWLCSECSDSHYTKPSNVYLIKFQSSDFSWLKFGFARHVSIRGNSYGVSLATLRDVISVVPFKTGYDAMLFEKSIHRKYKKNRYPKSKMIDYHIHNGFTECYPIEMLDTLIHELREQEVTNVK